MATAKNLQAILDNKIVSASLDRCQRIDRIIEQALAMWEADLSKRRPAPAYTTGVDDQLVYQGTDLDLFSILMALSQRKAVINIPDYERLRASSLCSNQHVISDGNRHGQVIRLVSNKDTHAFSVLINDYNVIEIAKDSDKLGAPRSFALVDDSGQFYKGWERVEWFPIKTEKDWLKERKLEIEPDVIEFKYFVHPALASSIYGSPYLATKFLALRIADQASHYRKIAQNLKEEGVKLPPVKGKEEVIYWKQGTTTPIKVQNLEAKLIFPGYKGEYPVYGIEDAGDNISKVKPYKKMPTDLKGKREVLRYALLISKKLSYKYGPIVRAPVRAVELAFFKYGFNKERREIKPGWAVPDWNRGYKLPNGRVRWSQLRLNDYVKLLYRIRETTAHRRI